MKSIFFNQDIPLQHVKGPISRKVLAYNKDLMAVEVYFDQPFKDEVHSHPHKQVTYVIEGTFEFNINNEITILNKGDSVIFEPNIPHCASSITKGKLLDVFTPCREDFLNYK